MTETVLIAGMFDMTNYGDQLFPLLAAERLRDHGFRVQPVAPSACPSAFTDALRPIDIATMLAGETDAGGILIGGGYMIHVSALNGLDRYDAHGTGAWCGAGLWVGATLAAALADIPVAWNAPGVPHPFAGRQHALLDATLRAASYVSVRDTGSARLLAAPADVPVAIVPDPAAEISRLWSRDDLAAAFRELRARKQMEGDAPLLAVHVRNRSLAGADPERFGMELGRFATARGLRPMLVAVGESHDDAALARRIARGLPADAIVLDDPHSLREIAAAIAHSAIYVGASLHGYVVAAAYGVPGVLVGRPAYHKFAGFLAHLGREDDRARDWSDALARADGRLGAHAGAIPAAVMAALDRHWDAIVAALASGRAHSARRTAFAKALLRAGVAADGPGWAMQPALNRRAVPRMVAPADELETMDVR